MTTVRWALLSACLAIAVAVGGAFAVHHYGAERYTAGRNDLLGEQAAADAKARAVQDAKTAQGAAGAEAARHDGAVAVVASGDAQQRSTQIITRIIHDSPAPAVCTIADNDPVLQELAASAARADAAADDLVRGKGAPGEGAAHVP